MGLYAFCLAGSNYLAPVICGFIAQYQGWQWAFYWPSIFIAAAFVWSFFFLEETNYVRSEHTPQPSRATSVKLQSDSGEEHDGEPEHESKSPETNDQIATEGPDMKDQKNMANETEKNTPDLSTEERGEEVVYHKKSYLRKLHLLGPKQPRNNMLRRAWHTLYYLSWPVIFYAGYVQHIWFRLNEII